MSHPDPYPQIPPALLNSGDIKAYAVHPDVRFIEPFIEDQLKSASYHIPCEGTVYAWKSVASPIGAVEKVEFALLKEGASFTIGPNSIVYIFPATVFKLPDYLAIRFNLTISKVHQGLLLGTGPLVDPGFEGRLLIPLHNLTNQGVELHADEMLMWVEVTKLSPDQTKLSNGAHRFPSVTFPKNKKNMPASAYFRQANQGKPILSSVQMTLDESKTLNAAMKSMVEKWSFFTAIGVVVGVASLIFASYQIVQTAHNKFDTLWTTSLEQRTELTKQKEEIDNLRKELQILKQTELKAKVGNKKDKK